MSEIAKQKQLYSVLYGAVVGLAFAISTWGVDALILAGANARLPFLEFIPGMLICLLVGALVGWLTARVENGFIKIFFWLGFGILLVWLMIFIPFNATPFLLQRFDPSLSPLLHYSVPEKLWQFWLFGAFTITGPALISGVLQNNLVESAIGSPYRIAKVSMLIIPIILMVLAGLAANQMIGRNLRDPVVATHELLQFAGKNYGKEVDPILARAMRLSSAKELGNLVGQDYTLTVIGFDQTMGSVDILVDFPRTRATCMLIYSQAVRCSKNPGQVNLLIS